MTDNRMTHCREYDLIDRRTFLKGTLSSAAFLVGNRLLALPASMPRLHLADPHIGPRGDTLICIFLRGGADGLNIIVPHGDESYYQRRPTVGIPRPDDLQKEGRTIDLDGFFGLHPTLQLLQPIYQAQDLALVHATGSPDETRSHFEAMNLMERGATTNGDYSGWLARHLATLDTGNDSALRAVGIGEMLPASLTGAVSATALRSIGDYHLVGEDRQAAEMAGLLRALYAQDDSILSAVAQQTFAALDVLRGIDRAAYQPYGRAYPEGDLGQALQTVAQLIKADVGLEVACIDFGGWDTHVAQGGSQGLMARLLAQLGQGLAAFYEDVQQQMDRVTLVVMSEFGRRAQENGGLGTDHGHGNMMMLMGGGILGGKVTADWPGLQEENLAGSGDLAITTDYRDVLGEIVRKRLNNPLAEQVFPDYEVRELGLVIDRTSA